MFAHNCWYVAGWDKEFREDRLFAVRIADHPIVLYRKANGALVALQDRCRHRFAPLSLGCREGDDLRCMYHGLKYAPDGKCIEIPGQDAIPDIARVTSYPVLERHSWIWVWIGDPAQADPALIPPAVGYDDGRYCLRHGHLDYAAPYDLINDNLLDFSHLTYVHRASFGAGPEFAYQRPKISSVPRGVRVERWTEDRPPLARPGKVPIAPRVDIYLSYDFLVPGVLLMYNAAFPAGTAAAVDRGVPDYGRALESNFTSQAVTPMTAVTSRYFFSWGPESARSEAPDAEADGMLQLALKAFGEDKTMIEAQYRSMQDPHPPVMPTTADKPVLMFQRLMRSMMPDAEKRGSSATPPSERPLSIRTSA